MPGVLEVEGRTDGPERTGGPERGAGAGGGMEREWASLWRRKWVSLARSGTHVAAVMTGGVTTSTSAAGW